MLEIKNLTEFISIILEINNSTINYRSKPVSSLNFFRGQANSDWNLEPKLYRENLFEKESILISEFLRVAPNHFKNLRRFDQLVKMQHYGLPTRLLDTTQNPLVALFFACLDNSQRKNDGSVYVFSQLPTFTSDNPYILLVIKYIFEYSASSLEMRDFLQTVINDSTLHSPYALKISNINEILHCLTAVPYYTVIPNLSNKRILNQDGAFLLFGMKIKNKKENKNQELGRKVYYQFEKLKFNNDPSSLWKNSEKIIIPSKYKEIILEELSLVGITKSKMFPELENQAEIITNKIKKSLNL